MTLFPVLRWYSLLYHRNLVIRQYSPWNVFFCLLSSFLISQAWWVAWTLCCVCICSSSIRCISSCSSKALPALPEVPGPAARPRAKGQTQKTHGNCCCVHQKTGLPVTLSISENRDGWDRLPTKIKNKSDCRVSGTLYGLCSLFSCSWFQHSLNQKLSLRILRSASLKTLTLPHILTPGSIVLSLVLHPASAGNPYPALCVPWWWWKRFSEQRL